MVTPQLVDYIKEQVRAGIAQEGVKKALLDAGWTASDVEDSMKAAIPVGAPVVVNENLTKAQPSVGAGAFGEKTADKPFSASGQSQTAMSQPAVRPSAVQGAGPSASFQSKFSNLVQPSVSVSPVANPSGMMSKPVSETASSGPMVAELAAEIPERKKKVDLLTIILGALLAIALIGAGTLWFFMSRKISSLEEQGGMTGAAQQALNAQVASLTASQEDLNAQVASITGERDELLKELSFFVALFGSGTSTVAITVKGDVSKQAGNYLITTMHGVALTIGNAKNAKVIAALDPLVGQSIEVSGTHPPASRILTLEAIAGVAIE